MIKLIKFPPAFNLPDPSPFCMKVMVLLKMAGLAYEPVVTTNPGKGPKGKLPAIEDDGQRIGDSEIIRWHIERKYGIDFDQDLGPAERAQAHAFARLLEERTYWIEVYNRWLTEPNWSTIRRAFFGGLPPVVRSLVPILARRKVRGYLDGQGIGRHTAEERREMGARDVRAIAQHLGDKPFFMGAAPTGADATVYAFVAAAVDPPFASPMKEEALRHANLVAYNKRMRERFFA
jgi:glutathione S-transferase